MESECWCGGVVVDFLFCYWLFYMWSLCDNALQSSAMARDSRNMVLWNLPCQNATLNKRVYPNGWQAAPVGMKHPPVSRCPATVDRWPMSLLTISTASVFFLVFVSGTISLFQVDPVFNVFNMTVVSKIWQLNCFWILYTLTVGWYKLSGKQ